MSELSKPLQDWEVLLSPSPVKQTLGELNRMRVLWMPPTVVGIFIAADPDLGSWDSPDAKSLSGKI